jgi:hypothetical protein
VKWIDAGTGDALQLRRQARASPAPIQPGWLMKPFAAQRR